MRRFVKMAGETPGTTQGLPAGYRRRAIVAEDAARVARHRAAMYSAMGELDPSETDRLASLSEPVIREALLAGSYFGFCVFAEAAPEQDVAGAGVLLRPLWPSPVDGRGPSDPHIEGTVMNVFVEPAHQRRGIARALMVALESECAARGVSRLRLYASTAGRHLYERLGYAPTNELRLPGPPKQSPLPGKGEGS